MRRYRNRVLSGLSESDQALLEPDLAPCELQKGQVLDRPNAPIESVYFPESGVASVIAVDTSGRRIEVGPFGREGISGTAIVMGTERSPMETSVQVEGTAYRIRAELLCKAMDESPELHRRLLRYVQAFACQTAQTLLINSYADIEQRLARWLLMAHDRIDGDNLPLTHDFVAVMLGVRRPGVTEATHKLEERGLIRATRGLIVIRDRRGLESLAGAS